MNYNLTYLSCDDTDQKLKNRSVQILNDFFKTESYNIKQDEWQLIFIASGGSEQNAVQLINEHQNIILLCHRENNSWAAAAEIAA